MANFEHTFVRIAISKPDGGVAIMQFLTLVKRNEDDPGYVREATPENIEAELTKSGFGGLSWRIIQDDEIPQDRTFRNAWTDAGDKIGHDMEKARAIHMDRIRAARAPVLAALDTEINKAADAGKANGELAALRAKRQALRDIPQTFDLSKAQTPEALKALWPVELSDERATSA